MITSPAFHPDGKPALAIGLDPTDLTKALVHSDLLHITAEQMSDLGLPDVHVYVLLGRLQEEMVRLLSGEPEQLAFPDA